MVSEQRRAPSAAQCSSNHPPLSRVSTQHSVTPLMPQNTTAPGVRFGGFGFGKQGEKAAAERGWKISRPMDSLPS